MITLLGNAWLEWRLRVAVVVSTVGGGELAIDVDDNPGFIRAGTGFIGRKNSGSRCGDGQSFVFGKEAQGNLDCAGLRVDAVGFRSSV